MMSESHAQEKTIHRGIDVLPFAIKFPGLKKGSTLYFLEDNKDKAKIIRETLTHYEPVENIISFPDAPEKNSNIGIFKLKNKIHPPKIEFKKINPTKYRLRVHGVKSAFPIIFSETFHHNWQLYLVPWEHKQPDPSSNKIIQLISLNNTTDENDPDQADPRELQSFIQKGWVSDVNKKEPDKFHPYNFFKSLRKKTEHQKEVETAFISKIFSGTIQNDNLPDGSVDETWSYSELSIQCLKDFQSDIKCQDKGSALWSNISDSSSNVFLWPESLHWRVNGFANSWWILPESVKQLSQFGAKESRFYNQNPDGSIDFEIVIEFWPQRLFYWGISFSLVVFVLTLSALFFRYVSRKLFPHTTVES